MPRTETACATKDRDLPAITSRDKAFLSQLHALLGCTEYVSKDQRVLRFIRSSLFIGSSVGDAFIPAISVIPIRSNCPLLSVQAAFCQQLDLFWVRYNSDGDQKNHKKLATVIREKDLQRLEIPGKLPEQINVEETYHNILQVITRYRSTGFLAIPKLVACE